MITRDVIYDITALRTQGLSVDRYFDTLSEDTAPTFTNQFTDGVSPESLQDGKLLADVSSAEYEAGVSGWIIKSNGDVEFNDGTFRGSITGSSIDIGGSDSSSAHIDTDGNFWLGAATFAAAPARISKEGNAVFESIAIGGDTIQYVITNSGIFSYGDGSDGAATCDGSTAVTGMSRVGSTYTMTRDVYFTTLTVNNTVTVNTAGYRIFCSVSCTIDGHVHRDGTAGSGGADGFSVGNGGGGAGAVTLADGYLKGSGPSGAGGNGGNDGANGSAAGAVTAVTNCLTSNTGAPGQNGGAGKNGAHAGGAGASAGAVTASNVKLIANWHLATLLDISSSGATVKFTAGANAGGGGGGGGDAAPTGDAGAGGGGSGGTGGGMLAIYAKLLTIGATGIISSNGGIGGNGGNGHITNGTTNQGGNGGGGGGGNGGVIALIYNELVNNGSITVTAGVGGQGGGYGGTGKTAANSGSTGLIYQFQLSL